MTILFASQKLQISIQKFQKIDVQKRSIVNSFFSIDTIHLIYETMKKSIIELFLFALFDIFNSIRFHQNSKKKRFNQIVIFVQHFQQCQHLYNESKLLERMKIIFCNFVDIWFENQSNFIFLHDFDIILTKTFFKRSNFSLFTFKIELKSTKKSTTCRYCKQTFKFKKFFRKHKREKHVKKFVINSFFRFYIFKSICKTKKKSTIISIENVSKIISKTKIEWRSRIVYLFTKLKISRLNFSLNIFVIISKTMKILSIQKVAYIQTKCKQYEQNFDFNKEFFEHINEHKILKFVKSLFF